MLRKAAYAGSFYDARPEVLRKQFDLWFSKAELPQSVNKPKGVISPHAGFVYSGSCAAYSYKLVSQYKYKTAVILFPSHRANHFGFSVSPFASFETPLGQLNLDEDIADYFIRHGSANISNSYDQNEHSMEVQLPFLKYINPDIKIVPIMMGSQNKDTCLQLSELVNNVINDYPKDVIVIVSSDLSHYHSAVIAEKMDRNLINTVIEHDIHGFYQKIMEGKIEACGFGGILTLMHVSDLQRDQRFIELNYNHSGFVSNDFDQVVGYLSAALLQKNS